MKTGAPARCGFVSILGLPNAGKSTLVNALVGSKVSIVSKKVQTTRCRILGIAMHDNAQVILMDTPGIFAPRKNTGSKLERAMVEAAWSTLDQADAVVHIVDTAYKNVLRDNEMIIEKLPRDKPCILVLNKTDKAGKPDLLQYAAGFNERFPYSDTFMVSALQNDRVKDVLSCISSKMPEEAWRFDPEQTSDIPIRFMAAEITREKIFHQLHEELPYAVLVETESWDEGADGKTEIGQVIYVQKDSQKGIVVGNKGSRIKEIGTAARLEMEELFGMKIHLKLFVKVQENWSERAENFSIVGL